MEQCWASLGIEIVLGALQRGEGCSQPESLGRRFLRGVSEEGLKLTPLFCLHKFPVGLCTTGTSQSQTEALEHVDGPWDDVEVQK